MTITTRHTSSPRLPDKRRREMVPEDEKQDEADLTAEGRDWKEPPRRMSVEMERDRERERAPEERVMEKGKKVMDFGQTMKADDNRANGAGEHLGYVSKRDG